MSDFSLLPWWMTKFLFMSTAGLRCFFEKILLHISWISISFLSNVVAFPYIWENRKVQLLFIPSSHDLKKRQIHIALGLNQMDVGDDCQALKSCIINFQSNLLLLSEWITDGIKRFLTHLLMSLSSRLFNHVSFSLSFALPFTLF